MSDPVPVIRIDSHGNAIEANGPALALLGAPSGEPCSAYMRARDHHGQMLCTNTCAHHLLDQSNGVGALRGAMVRGQLVMLQCTRVGEEAVLVILPTNGLESWPETLTPREREVISLVARGETSKNISKVLGICTATVRTHVEHIRDKLGARTRAEAVAKALVTGQIS